MKTRNKILLLAGTLLCAGGVGIYAIVTAVTPESLCTDLQKTGLVSQCENGITIQALKDLPRYKARWSFQPQGDSTSGTIVQFDTDDDLQHVKQTIQDWNAKRETRVAALEGMHKERLTEQDLESVSNYQMYSLSHRILLVIPVNIQGAVRDSLTRQFGYPEE
jgi:hypothetical protein